jgi:hypothetical protein
MDKGVEEPGFTRGTQEGARTYFGTPRLIPRTAARAPASSRTRTSRHSEMLDHQEGHARLVAEPLEEIGQGFQSARGSADADDRKRAVPLEFVDRAFGFRAIEKPLG